MKHTRLAALALATALALPATAVLTSTPAAASGACADVLVIGARGSGEAADSHEGLGSKVAALVDLVQTRVGSRVDIAVDAVNYPALSVVPDALLHPVDYFNGLNTGVSDVSQELRNQAATCPNQQFVLVGYSQGAMVMHRALHAFYSTESKALRTRILATVLIADGDRVANDITDGLGGYDVSRNGLGLIWKSQTGSTTATFDTDFLPQWNVLNVCRFEDLVCDPSAKVAKTAATTAAAVAVVPEVGATGLVSAWLKTGPVRDAYATHLSYTDALPEMQQAAAQVATTILRTPFPSPRTVNVTAPAGVTFTRALEAHTAVPVPVSWRLAPGAVLPAGLTLSSGGVVAGIPSQTASGTTTVQVRWEADGRFGHWQNLQLHWVPPSVGDYVVTFEDGVTLAQVNAQTGLMFTWTAGIVNGCPDGRCVVWWPTQNERTGFGFTGAPATALSFDFYGEAGAHQIQYWTNAVPFDGPPAGLITVQVPPVPTGTIPLATRVNIPAATFVQMSSGATNAPIYVDNIAFTR